MDHIFRWSIFNCKVLPISTDCLRLFHCILTDPEILPLHINPPFVQVPYRCWLKCFASYRLKTIGV